MKKRLIDCLSLCLCPSVSMCLSQGTCGAAIMSEESMLYGFNGDFNAWDCEEEESGSVSGFQGDGFTASKESGLIVCLSLFVVL